MSDLVKPSDFSPHLFWDVDRKLRVFIATLADIPLYSFRCYTTSTNSFRKIE
jgi:hypothetical protein